MNNKIWDCVVVGAGVSGMTAAMYLKRANIDVLIIEKDAPGGLLNKSSLIENYPGLEKMSGPDLAYKFFAQVNELKIPYKYGNVIDIKNVEEQIKTVVLENEEIKTKKIILALGRMPKSLNDTNQESATGKGVSFCSLCDGSLYKGEDVAIVGGGNSAVEEALYLSRIASKVYILNRSESLKADEILKERLAETANIEILYNCTIKEFNLENDKLQSLTLIRNLKEEVVNVKACFIFIGYTPQTNFLKKLDILNEKGYINVDENKETKFGGIFASGDVIEKSAYQIATATSDAIIAATKCIKDLSNEE